MLTLITCTGERQEAFSLCERWIGRQDYAEPYQWIVVDDGRETTQCSMGQQVIRRAPQQPKAKHVERMPASIKAALPYVRGDAILFIEDDDWYGPRYLSQRAEQFTGGNADVIGESPVNYYHVRAGLWRTWSRSPATSALAATLLRTSAIRKLPSYWIDIDCPYLDVRLWTAFECGLVRMPVRCEQFVGMKAMPGRAGISPGHDAGLADWIADADGSVLRRWLGDDAGVYEQYKERA